MLHPAYSVSEQKTSALFQRLSLLNIQYKQSPELLQ